MEQTETHNGPIAHISEHRTARFDAIVSTLLAATLLIGAIVALKYVQSKDRRIALIAVFAVMFAGSVGRLTTASRAEVFAATAAFAAVLVVFVSGEKIG